MRTGRGETIVKLASSTECVKTTILIQHSTNKRSWKMEQGEARHVDSNVSNVLNLINRLGKPCKKLEPTPRLAQNATDLYLLCAFCAHCRMVTGQEFGG